VPTLVPCRSGLANRPKPFLFLSRHGASAWAALRAVGAGGCRCSSAVARTQPASANRSAISSTRSSPRTGACVDCVELAIPAKCFPQTEPASRSQSTGAGVGSHSSNAESFERLALAATALYQLSDSLRLHSLCSVALIKLLKLHTRLPVD
jgi:hypothetical protein